MEIKSERNDNSNNGNASSAQSTPLPPVNFSTFVLSLNSSALVHLGELQIPGEKTETVNLNLARHSIDVLAMLEEKTAGNLTDDEAKLLKHVLYDLRMKFIAASR